VQVVGPLNKRAEYYLTANTISIIMFIIRIAVITMIVLLKMIIIMSNSNSK